MKILPLTLMTWMGDDRAVFRCHGDKRRVRIVGGVTDVRPLALGSNKAGQHAEGTQMVGLERCLHLPRGQLPSIHRVLTTTVTPVPGDWLPSPDLCGCADIHTEEISVRVEVIKNNFKTIKNSCLRPLSLPSWNPTVLWGSPGSPVYRQSHILNPRGISWFFLSRC